MSLFQSDEAFLIASETGPVGPPGPQGPEGPEGPSNGIESIVNFLDTEDFGSIAVALFLMQSRFSIPDGSFRLAFTVGGVNFVAEVTYLLGTGTVDSQISPLPDSVRVIRDGSGYLNNSSFWDFITLRQRSKQGIVASATQTQGQQPLIAAFNRVQTVANNNDVVTLPAAENGIKVFVFNDGGSNNSLQIFPASGDDLGNGVDQSFDLLDGESVSFSGFDDTNWKVGGLQKKFTSIELVDNGLIQPFAFVFPSTTQVQGAGNIFCRFNVASTVANENDVLTLPTSALGLQISVVNDAINTIQIFPQVGAFFPGQIVNTPIFLKGGQQVTFLGVSPIQWNPSTITVLELDFLEMLTTNFIRTQSLIIASTTQTQGQAPLIATFNRALTFNDNDVVTLPDAVEGEKIEVVNESFVFTLQVFPALGDGLGLGLNIPLFLLPGESIAFIGIGGAAWRFVGLQRNFTSINIITDDFLRVVETGITANTTQSQGVTPLTATFNEVANVNNLNDVVTLQPAVKGQTSFIFNDGVNTLQIFPASGDDLGNGVDQSFKLGVNEDIEFVAISATTWKIRTTTITLHGEFHQENNLVPYSINAINELHAFHGSNLTFGDLAGMVFDPGGAGVTQSIVAIAFASGIGILVTTGLAHGLSIGSIVSQTNLSNSDYVGIFKVVTVPSPTTYTVAAFFGITGTGSMDHAATLNPDPISAGVYAVDYSLSATPAIPNETFDFEIFINEAQVLGTKRTIRFGPAGDFRVIAGSGIIFMGVGDKLSFAFENLSSAGNLTIEDISVRAIRL